MKDNDKIHRGYRVNFHSKKQLLKSLFMVHNESVNIWTHLLPLLVLLCVFAAFYIGVDDLRFKTKMS